MNTEFTCDRCGKPFIPNELSLENSHYNLIIKNVSPYDNCYCVCYDCYRKFRLFAQGHKLVDEDNIKDIWWNKETNKYDTIKYDTIYRENN